MPARPRLSICIPTFNRLAFLKEAVESILDQVNDGNRHQLELVISDNASADGTREFGQKLRAVAGVAVVYNRNEVNLGFDDNILKLVEIASGEYCWLLGDDDRLAPGALDEVLTEIEVDPDIDLFMGDKEDFNEDFSHRFKRRPIFKGRASRTFDFSGPGLNDYLAYSDKLICFFNFISILVFKREKWLAVPDQRRFVGSGYIHLYMIMSLLWRGRGGRLKCLPEVIVSRRWGTDRITGIFGRLKNDVEVYERILRAVTDDQALIRHINGLLIKNDAYSWAVRSKIGDGLGFYQRSFPLLFKHYWSYPLFWLKMFPLLFIPGSLLRLFRWSYRRLVKGEAVGLADI